MSPKDSLLMGFAAIRERRAQLASTIKPRTPFRAAVIAAQLIEFARGLSAGNIAMEQALLAEFGTIRHRGKGGGRPHHSSVRFVAMDKRAARKVRNCAR